MQITPAAASAMLKRLETALGVRLFERSTRSMRLTMEGGMLLDYTGRAFSLLNEGITRVVLNRESMTGTLRIAAPSDLVRSTLLHWLNEFQSEHRGLQLVLTVGDRLLDVIRDEVDIAIRYGDLADSGFVVRTLAVVRPIVSASPAYFARHPAPQSPADLQTHNCLITQRGGQPYRVWRFLRDGQWTEVAVRGDRTSDDASLARVWALAGVGLMMKGPIEQRDDLAHGALVQVLREWQTAPYPLHAIMPSGRHVPNRVRSVVDFLADKFSRLATESG